MSQTKVFIVNFKSEADYTVYFCNFQSEQKNHQIIEGAKLVNNKSEANIKLFIVKFASEAKIIIMKNNFPK